MSSGNFKQPQTTHPGHLEITESLLDLLRISDKKILEQISSSLAHELNQPLTALLNYLQACLILLEKRGDQTELTGMLGKAVIEIRRLDDIITRLRDYVEVEQIVRNREDINAIVNIAYELVIPALRKEEIASVCELQPDLPMVAVDRNLILLVLLNLLQNSVQALKRSITRRILIRTCMHEDRYIELTVQDTGPGVDPDILQSRFFTLSATRQGVMGIGLTLCQSIIDDHGGRLWAEANPEGGAGFHFILPVVAGDC